MNVKAVYITREEFESYLACDRFYEGFVIGVGYAYVDEKMTQPDSLNGYRHRLSGRFEMGYFGFIKFQCIDTSPEMIGRSRQAAVAGTYEEYYVSKGDSLWGIADKLGITVNDIARWNNIKTTDTIYPGQVLMIDIEKVEHKDGMDNGTVPSKYGIDYSEVLNLSFSIASDAIEVKLLMENYKFLNGLARNNQFLGIKNGMVIIMDDTFLSTKRMRKVRGEMKSNFTSKVTGLKYLKWGGNILGGVTTAYSGYRFYKNSNLEDGVDVAFGTAGIFYWPVGVMYGGGKFLYNGQMRHYKFMREQGLIPGKDDMMIMWK